jgi:hypothetical protein
LGKRLHVRHRHKWDDNIKMDLIDWRDMDWIHLAEVRVKWWAAVSAVINLWVR